MKESVMRTKAKAFALHVLAVCDTIDTKKNRGALVNQIVRSSTSIGANIHEAARPQKILCNRRNQTV